MKLGLGLGLASTRGALTAAAAPVVSAISPNLGDTAGGGGFVSITVDSSVGCTGATLGGTALTSFSIVNATTVKGIPGAHALGTVNVVVTNATGTSTGGTGLFEYWTPAQVTGVAAYLDANKGVTEVAGAVSAWLGQDAGAKNFVQATGANKPTKTAAVFGTLPSIRFATSNWLSLAATAALTGGKSYFAVAAWTDATPGTGLPPGSPSAARPGAVLIGDDSGDYFAFGADAGQLAFQQYNAPGSATHYSVRGSGLNTGSPLLVGVTANTTSDEKMYVGTTQQGATYSPVVDDFVQGYRCIGAGYGGGAGGAHAHFWIGDIGAVVIASGVISAGDHTKLNTWAQQRFGTP